MVSVTPDISASTSFQAPPPRAKADASPANDSFASLVDSNTTAATSNHDRAQDRARDTSPAPQRSASGKPTSLDRRDDAATVDRDRTRDAKSMRERGDIADRDVAAVSQPGTEGPAKAGGNKRPETKSADGKAEDSKPAEKPSSDETGATDSTDTQAAEPAKVLAAITVVVATQVQAPAVQANVAGGGTSAIVAAGNAVVTVAAGTPAATADNAPANKVAAAEVEADAQAEAGELTTKAGQGAPSADATMVPASRSTTKTTAVAKASITAGEAAASDDASTAATEIQVTNTAIPSGTEQPALAKSNLNVAHTATKIESAGDQAASVTAHFNPVGHDAASGQSSAPGSTVQAAPSFQPLIQTTAAQQQPSFTATAATQSTAVPLSGLAMEIAASVRSGKSRFEIRLDPAELGRIDVRIDVDRNGQVSSHLTVEKPETLSMLRQDAPQLQRALNDAGLSTGNGGLQFSLRDQSSSGQNGNQSNPNAQRLILGEDEAAPASVAGQYGRMLGTSGGVDIRV